MLIRLPGCAGWNAPLLFANGKSRFSHNESHYTVTICHNNFIISILIGRCLKVSLISALLPLTGQYCSCDTAVNSAATYSEDADWSIWSCENRHFHFGHCGLCQLSPAIWSLSWSLIWTLRATLAPWTKLRWHHVGDEGDGEWLWSLWSLKSGWSPPQHKLAHSPSQEQVSVRPNDFWKSRSCPMKLKLGDILGLHVLT